MKTRDFFSERMIFGVLVILGYLGLAAMILTGYAASKGVSDTMQGVVLGAMGAGIPLILQATFRTDRIDQQRAETASTMASALAAATPTTPPPSPTETP